MEMPSGCGWVVRRIKRSGSGALFNSRRSSFNALLSDGAVKNGDAPLADANNEYRPLCHHFSRCAEGLTEFINAPGPS